jgi:hypothetical protein
MARWVRWALAAGLLIACGGLIYQFGPSSEAQAAPDVMQQLIDWHLELSDADADHRQAIFDQQASELTRALDQAKLPAEDAELGRKLIDEAQWLVKNHDPLAEATHFNKLADHMLGRLNVTAAVPDKHNSKVSKVAREYSKAEEGVRNNVQKLELAGNVSGAKLEEIHDRQLKRKSSFAALVNSLPESSQKAIKSAVDPTVKPAKKGGRHRKRDLN